jgi:hypothetical protein
VQQHATADALANLAKATPMVWRRREVDLTGVLDRQLALS